MRETSNKVTFISDLPPFPNSYFTQFEPITAVVNLKTHNPDALHPDFPEDKLGIYQDFMQSLHTALDGRPVYNLELPEDE